MGRTTVGLALGGGGARGAAHIGVLQVLNGSGMKIDRIAGTSAGSVIGAMYAATRDPQWIENRFREFLRSKAFEHLGTRTLVDDRDPDSVFGQVAKYVQDRFVIVMSLNRSSVVKRDRLVNVIDFLLPVKRFEDLQIPLDVLATDLQSGESVCYNSGDLVEAVVQSSSIPGYVPPKDENGRKMVDGGVGVPIPVEILKNQVDYVIAVDISRSTLSPLEKSSIIDVLSRSERITSLRLTQTMVAKADYVIKPDVKGLHWSQFEKFDTLVDNGRRSTEETMQQLESSIKERKKWRWRFKHWIGIAS